MPIAFFDLDKTLLADNSAKLWLKAEWQSRQIKLFQMIHASYWLAKYHLGFTHMEEVIEKGLAQIVGQSHELIMEKTTSFFNNTIKNLYRPGALEAIKQHRELGRYISLLTSSFDGLSLLVKQDLQLDYCLCSTLEVDSQGYYTGRTIGPPCFGPNKVSFARKLCEELGEPLEQCYFYTDSASDVPLLNLVGQPVAVNPDPHLRARAQIKKWAIVDWGEARMEKTKLAIIDDCRQKITAIDREILLLVKHRERLSAQIGQAKRELSIPDKDFSRERAVFDHAIACAQELDLPESFAIKMSELVMGLSLSRQERDRIRNNIANAPLSVAVIGGSGRLGRWLCHFFADSGHTITVIDQVKPNFLCSYQVSFDQTITKHDLIIVATPIRVSADMLNQLSTYNLTKPVIFDVSSVKAPVREALLKLSQQGAQVTSLHPMFGPSVEVLFGKHIIITSVANSKADNFAKNLFKSTSVNIVDMSFDQHDHIISYLLSLSHLLNIIFIEALNHSGFSIDFLSRFSSTTFSNLLSIAQRVFSENPQLYYEIQALNPHNQACYQALSDSLASALSAINTHNEQAFVNLMQAGQNYLGLNNGAKT